MFGALAPDSRFDGMIKSSRKLEFIEENKMSILGNMAMVILRITSQFMKNGVYDINEEIKKAKEYNKKHIYSMPHDSMAFYKELTIADYPCLIIQTKKKPVIKDKAILFLHGGIKNDWKSELFIARGYANRTGMDIWYPIYPPITEVSITKTIEVIYQMYRQMIKKYNAEKIAIVGGSFGGFFALEIINWINRNGMEVKMPGLLIANSPAGLPDTEEDWELMRYYAKKDPILNVFAMEMVEGIVKYYDEKVPGYALYPMQGDFHNAPKTFIYYAEETCAGVSAAYVRVYERDGSANQIHMHIEPNMMHCYACCPVFAESRRDFYEQINLLNEL